MHTSGTPEAWLIDSKTKPPKSRQWNLGVRQVVSQFAISATYAGVRGVDQLGLSWAQFGLNPNGSCCVSFNLGAHGFSNYIYSTNDKKTWYEALLLQVDRPYRREAVNRFGWGAGLTYTYAVRSVQGADGLGDDFDFPNSEGIPKHPANDEKHRIVGNWIMDLPFAYGIQFSGIVTLGGKYKQDVGCNARFCPADGTNTYERGAFTVPGTFPYRNVDLRLRKDLPTLSRTTLGLTVDVFNAFNRANFGGYDTGSRTIVVNGVRVPNPHFGLPGNVVSDGRRFQIGAEYTF